MKKLLASLALLAAALPAAHAQVQEGTVSFNLNLGLLADASGNPLSDGSLLQVLASYSGNSFNAPTQASFTGGDAGNGLLWQGSFDSTTVGLAGAMSFSLPDLPVYASGTSGAFLKEGDALLVRWFPSLSASAIPSAPGLVSYGQFGFGFGDSSWLVPGAGNSVDLNLYTVAVEGVLPDSVGYAGLRVSEGQPSLTPVPEPSTYALLGASSLGLVIFSRRKFRRRS